MYLEKVLFAATLAVVLQFIAAEKTSFRQIGTRDFVEINGTTYFIDTTENYRDDSRDICESLNMTMISFETRENYFKVAEWLAANGYDSDWFWTGALRNAGSTLWYWEPTGNAITEFVWGRFQPTMNDNLIRACLNFNLSYGGWDDDNCALFLQGTICE